MDSRILRLARLAALGPLALIGVSCDNSGTRSTPTSVAPMVETRVGSVRAHQAVYINFSMASAGLVTLKVEPVLHLTLRSGKAPEDFGQFITNSDNGGLTTAAPVGTNSVVIGNPFDEDKAFSLAITHPN